MDKIIYSYTYSTKANRREVDNINDNTVIKIWSDNKDNALAMLLKVTGVKRTNELKEFMAGYRDSSSIPEAYLQDF